MILPGIKLEDRQSIIQMMILRIDLRVLINRWIEMKNKFNKVNRKTPSKTWTLLNE